MYSGSVTVVKKGSAYQTLEVVEISLQGFIQDFELGGGGEQGGSRMVVARKRTLTHASAFVPTRGVWGMPPGKILNLDPLRLLLMQSGTRLFFNTCDKTIVTILNFKISWEGGGGGIPGLPLCMKPCNTQLYCFV